MKKRNILAAAMTALALTVGSATVVGASEWSWANYGFSGTAIANPDPFESTSYLIGGYVATINHENPLTSSYVYDGDIILDTEGVALRFRFSWTNTEAGYKAVADLQNGIAVYPMDESIDVVIVTESGLQRYSFPTPAAYDYMEVNDFAVKDNGEAMVIEVCGRIVAVLKFSGTRTVGTNTCFAEVTVTDRDGYVYGRVSDSLVLASGGYAGYSSQKDRALILVKSHTLEGAEFDLTLPEEKETAEGWKPAPEPIETLPESLPETEPETTPATESETISENESQASPETHPLTEPSTEAPDGGCGAVMGGTAALLMGAAAAVVLGKKRS